MTYYSGDDSDDGIRPIDMDDLYDEVSSIISTAVEATGDESIDIEINIVSKYEVELGLSCAVLQSRLISAQWFDDIEDIKSQLVNYYPDGNWEDSGWR